MAEHAVVRTIRAALRPPRYRWWHALAFGVAANLAGRVGSGKTGIYERQRQAPFAPPGWAFAPAWTINNVATLWGNLRLLNLPPETPGRRELLRQQGASWLLFVSFTPSYFGLRSPILGLAVTAGMYGVTIASALRARRIDRRIALSLLPLLLWLSLATPVAAYAALHNPDRLFRTPAWQ